MIQFEEDHDEALDSWSVFCDTKLKKCCDEMAVAANARGIPFTIGMKIMAQWLANAAKYTVNAPITMTELLKSREPDESALADKRMSVMVQRHIIESELDDSLDILGMPGNDGGAG